VARSKHCHDGSVPKDYPDIKSCHRKIYPDYSGSDGSFISNSKVGPNHVLVVTDEFTAPSGDG
jgi:hypothetical protein